MEIYKYIHEHIARTIGFKKTQKHIQELTMANRAMGTNMRKEYGRVTQVVGRSTKVIGKDQRMLTRTFKTTGGAIVSTVEKQGKGFKNLVKGHQGLSKVSKTTTRRMGDFTKALRRVAIVVPVWMLARTVIQGVLRTLSEGVKQLIDFDRQLEKSRSVIHGFAGSTDTALEILRETFRNFSMEAGIAIDKLTSAFYRFGTVGIEFQDAMAGAIASAKLARITFGNVDTIARSLAMAYRLLGRTMDESLTPAEKMEALAGMIYKLWQKNAFEVDELAQSLSNFVGMANVANFTMSQTLSLLSAIATAGMRAGRGGRLLNTAIFKLIANLDKLAPMLGLAVKEGEETFDIFMRVVDAVTSMSEAGRRFEAIEVIGAIFGGIRPAKIIASLIAVKDLVKENFEITADQVQVAKELNQRYLEIVDSISVSADRIKEIKKHIGELFIRAVAGGDSLEKSLENVANFLEDKLIPGVQVLGDMLNKLAWISPIWKWAKNIEDATKELDKYQKMLGALTAIQVKLRIETGKLSPEEIQKLKESAKTIALKLMELLPEIYPPELKLGELVDTKEYESAMNLIQGTWKGILELSIEELKKEKERLKLIEEEAEETEKVQIFRRKIHDLEKDVSGVRQELKIIELEAKGLEKIEILRKTAIDEVKDLVEEYNKLWLDKEQKIKVKPIGLDETFNLIQDFIKGTEEVTAEMVIEFFPGIRDISKVERYKDAVKAIIALIKEGVKVSADLTGKEKERIDIAHKLNIAKRMGILSSYEVVRLETKLTKQSKYTYNAHEKKLKLYQLERQRLQELYNIIRKTKDLQLSAMERYVQATEEEREAMDEILKLLALSPTGLAEAVKKLDEEEKKMLFTLKDLFTPTQWKKGLEGLAEAMGWAVKKGLEKGMEAIEQRRATWTTETVRAMGWIGPGLKTPFPYTQTIRRQATGEAKRQEEKLFPRIPTGLGIPQVSIAPSFGGITINLPRGTLKEIAELSGKELTELLKASPEFKALFSQNFWGENTKGH